MARASSSSGRRLGKRLDAGESFGDRNEQAAEGIHRKTKISAAERYLAGGLAFHLHFRMRRSKAFVEPDTRDFCAVFNALQRRGPGSHRGIFDQVSLGLDRSGAEAHRGIVEVDVEAVEDAVLVDVPEKVEMPDAVFNVPSLVRLQALQDCDGVFVEESPNAMRPEPSGIAGDGEGDFAGDVWLPEFLDRVRAACQQPRRLVEGRAGVMDDIADHEAELEVGGRVAVLPKAKDVASGLVIELADDTKRLRLKESLSLVVESFQLLDCPIKLGSRSQ